MSVDEGTQNDPQNEPSSSSSSSSSSTTYSTTASSAKEFSDHHRLPVACTAPASLLDVITPMDAPMGESLCGRPSLGGVLLLSHARGAGLYAPKDGDESNAGPAPPQERHERHEILQQERHDIKHEILQQERHEIPQQILDPRVPILHRAPVQVVVFICVAMMSLGPYNGLNALGGGGLRNHLLATRMNAVYTMVVALIGWCGGVVYELIGCRVAMSISVLCYLSYSSVIWGVNFFSLTPNLSYIGGLFLGIGSSILWSTFGVVSIRYCATIERSKFFMIEWCCVNLGGFICGLVSLANNWNQQESYVSSNSRNYLVFITIVILAFVLAASFLRNQKTVYIKVNGAWLSVSDRKNQTGETGVAGVAGVAGETGEAGETGDINLKKRVYYLGSRALSCFKNKSLMHLWPLFLCPFIHAPMLFNGLNMTLFDIRTRSLNSSLYWSSRIVGGYLFYLVTKMATLKSKRSIGRRRLRIPATTESPMMESPMIEESPIMESPMMESPMTVSPTRRLGSPKPSLLASLTGLSNVPAAWGTALVYSWSFCSLTFILSIQKRMEGGAMLDLKKDFPECLVPMFAFVLFGILDAISQSLIYSLLGSLSGRNTQEAALSSGFYKSIQSFGTGTSWILEWLLTAHSSLTNPQRYKTHLGYVSLLWTMSLPGCIYTLAKLNQTTKLNDTDR